MTNNVLINKAARVREYFVLFKIEKETEISNKTMGIAIE